MVACLRQSGGGCNGALRLISAPASFAVTRLVIWVGNRTEQARPQWWLDGSPLVRALTHAL